MNINKVLSDLKNDFHIPVACGVFLVSTAVHVWHGLDVNFVAMVGTVLAFLGGHAWGQMKFSNGDNVPDAVPAPMEKG